MTSVEEYQSLSIRTAFLADYAKIEANGLFSVVGGGLTAFMAQGFPSPFAFAVVLQLASPRDVVVTAPLSLTVRRPGGVSALSLDGEARIGPARHALSNLAFNFNVIVDVEGLWEVHLDLGQEGARTDLTFSAELMPASG